MTSAARGTMRRLRRAARELTGLSRGVATATTGPVALTPPAANGNGDDRQRQLELVQEAIQAAAPSRAIPARSGLRVAVAASPRLARALAWEWDQIDLKPAAGVERLGESGAELLLIEVRAAGVPGWGPAERAPAELAAAARRSQIPVIVWVTTPPADPDSAAALVPLSTAVFVADGGAVAAWRERWPDAVVEELAPAAAPRLHSPAHGGVGARRVGDVAFVADDAALDDTSRTGLESVVVPATNMRTLPDVHMWRSRAAPGASRMEPLLPPAVKRSGVAGIITDLAQPVADHYRVVIDAARCSPNSTWTLLDAGAAQTAVVTLPRYKDALTADLRDHVGTAEDAVPFGREIVARVSQPEVRDREALQLHRAVLGGHTFGHRVDTILTTLGRPVVPADRSVSIVVPTNREHEIDNVLSNVARQAHRDIELILVLHGLNLNHADLRARAAERGIDRFQVIEADPSARLGALMNVGIDAAGGRYIAKMDDDNFYGRHYLTDLIHSFASTDAGVVGKWSHYVWLRAIDAVVLRYAGYQNRYHRLVQGGSIMVESELAEDLRFSDIPRAVDTDFLNRVWAAGVKTYSADRFNFVSVRGTDHEQHTWKVTDTEMMVGGADVVFYGDPRTHIDV